GAKVLQDLRYAYDPVGNVVSVRNDAEATRFWRNQKVVPENTYAYDSLYQLVSATGREMADARRQGQGRAHPALIAFDDATYTSYTRTYTYDTAGNLSQIRHSAPASGNSYTTDITVSARSNRAVLSTLAKDPTEVEALFHAGGQQRLLLPGQSLAWTPRGELDQVTPITRERGADDHERYRYDSASQRVLKSSTQQASGSTQKHQVLYLPGLELRRTASGDKVAEDLQVITVGEAGRAQVRVLHWLAGKPTDITNDQLRYSYDDQTGSGALEVDGTGELISQEEYYPYGGTALWTARNAMEARYKTVRYSGKERDATGLYYYGYRYYQPWVGRWLSADPAGTVDGLNVYCMVRGNPTSSVDEQGTMKKAFSSLLPPNKKAQFKTRMDEALATMKEAPVPKTIHMIWIGTRPISEKNKALSIETAQRNPDYTTRVLYDSGIAGHEAARDDLKRQFEDSGVEVSNVRDLPYFSQISAHPAFRFYEKVVNEGNYAQASDLLRLLVLLHEGGIYKDIDDTQQEPFGDLSLPAGLGFKQEYAASQGKASAVPNTPIAAAEGHAVIKKTLALAVDNYERGETDVLKLAGPDVFTQALYQELPLATNNIGTQWDNIKQGIYKNRKEVLTSEQFLLLREPREKMLAFGKKVFNGADHSWQKK
ncbi:RHS repeat-associated core domain-containing protein, partial [Pseudomonas sp. CK-NBRI-02]|uniref:RHS repeat-associated core domain-containing protein n=1 Tax=Pseudomonas sp. CK-NBRI-02 TaxID=2249759 RepID=UPI00273E186B